MGLSSLVSGRVFGHDELPLKLKALSRCFRPEIATNAAESKLYRVHEFNKVLFMFFLLIKGFFHERESIMERSTPIEGLQEFDLSLNYVYFLPTHATILVMASRE